MIQKHCWECGAALIEKPLEGEGIVPFCPVCGEYRFPMYNTAVSMIVTDEKTGRILLIQQYGRPSYILVAGYVNRGESAENAVRREILEETGLHAGAHPLQPNAVLRAVQHAHVQLYRLCSWTPTGFHTNREVDRYSWFSPADARRNIRPNSLAAAFLNAYLDEIGR